MIFIEVQMPLENNRGRVIRVVYDHTILPEEELRTGYLIQTIPDPDFNKLQEGYSYLTYYNFTTKRIEYEYVKPPNLEDPYKKIRELEELLEECNRQLKEATKEIVDRDNTMI